MENTDQDYNKTGVRKKAEEILKHQHRCLDQEILEADKLKLLHELQVHQIELELQYDELLFSREEAKSAKKYIELFESAPTSFFTLSNECRILELNVLASKLLEQNKDYLINLPLISFVHPDDRSIFDSFIKNIFDIKGKRMCELRLQKMNSGISVFVILTGNFISSKNKYILSALDITEQKFQKTHRESSQLGAIEEMTSSIAHDNSFQSLPGNLEFSMYGNETTTNLNRALSLLWVDDDDNIRIFVEEAIKLMGHNIVMSQNGREALQLLEKASFDLVITDIGLPEIDGWQLANMIKQKYNGSVKVAVIGGWSAQIEETELSKHGVKYMLNKPFKLSELRDLFDSVV